MPRDVRGFIAVTPAGKKKVGLINVAKILCVIDAAESEVPSSLIPEDAKSVIIQDPTNRNLHPEPLFVQEDVDLIGILINRSKGR